MISSGFPDGSVAKNPPASVGDAASIPSSGRSPEKAMATHSRILACEIPWTEEPSGIQSMESKKSQTRFRDCTTITPWAQDPVWRWPDPGVAISSQATPVLCSPSTELCTQFMSRGSTQSTGVRKAHSWGPVPGKWSLCTKEWTAQGCC